MGGDTEIPLDGIRLYELKDILLHKGELKGQYLEGWARVLYCAVKGDFRILKFDGWVERYITSA